MQASESMLRVVEHIGLNFETSSRRAADGRLSGRAVLLIETGSDESNWSGANMS